MKNAKEKPKVPKEEKPRNEAQADVVDETPAQTQVEASPAEIQAETPAEAVTENAVEPSVEVAPEAARDDGAELQARLAEAENRGYLRGRNERIEQLMREPSVFQRQPPAGQPAVDWQADSSPMILNNPRISIWDK